MEGGLKAVREPHLETGQVAVDGRGTGMRKHRVLPDCAWGCEEKIGRGLSASEQVRDPQHSANVISCEGWIIRALKLEGIKSDDRRSLELRGVRQQELKTRVVEVSKIRSHHRQQQGQKRQHSYLGGEGKRTPATLLSYFKELV